MDPQVARELSWCASKMREVAVVLSRISVRLTSKASSITLKMPGGDDLQRNNGVHETGGFGKEPELPFPPFLEEYSHEDFEAQAAS